MATTKLVRMVLDGAKNILGFKDGKGGLTNFVQSQVNPVTGRIGFSGRINAELTKAKIGKHPLRVSGIGNSIMFNPYSWWRQCCDKSNGLFVAIDEGYGVPGDSTSNMVLRMDDVPESADVVVIMECTNDGSWMDNATHRTNMRTLIEFYLGRGQLPIVCRPPARSDSSTHNDRTQTLGMIDYFLADEYAVPCLDPWRGFTDESTGLLAASAGAVDGLHPGYSSHNVAGAEMLAQLLGQSHTLPLPVANTTYGGLGLLANPLLVSALGSYGAGGVLSTVSDAAIPGNWARITGNGGGQFVAFQNTGPVAAGDDLFVIKRFKVSGGTAGSVSAGAYSPESFPHMPGRNIYGDAEGISHGYSGAAPTGGSSYVQDNIYTLGCEDGRYVQVAQCQIYNKTALLTR